jgi:catechol 2,3-dioxygenase-like lactoylglutathione lyase family enzyme
MAVTPKRPLSAAARIARLSLTTADPARTAAFYVDVLGFAHRAVEEWADGAFAELMGVPGGATATVLRLGEQDISLLAFNESGRPYPPNSAADDRWFQHMAIVVADMAAACARLKAAGGWSPIGRDGPQRLPASSGGAVAFKFRDPEGHPLELLEFPGASGGPAGIDHSAIVVEDTERSFAVYKRALGFTVRITSLNRGIEQERLDGVPSPVLEVTGLRLPKAPPPHLEFLCYREPRRMREVLALRSNDVAAMRLELNVTDVEATIGALVAAGCEPISRSVVTLADGRAAALVRDPDGHHLLLIADGR